jgi:hypothetical protein
MKNKFTGKVERLMNRLITMSIYERLNKGETVDKAQLAFIDTSEKSMRFMVKSLNQQDF